MVPAAGFHYASDRSLLVRFGGGGGQEALDGVVALLRSLESEPIEGMVNLHPAYDSILLAFDAGKTDHGALERAVAERMASLDETGFPEPRVVEVPVLYGGEDGPDLQDVGGAHGLTPGQVVELHASVEYRVAFLGFAPGFAYLSGLPAALATPRLPVPRKRVPAGSVGIAGNQTGIYPLDTPGGWRLIGRTSLEMFRADRNPMALLRAGDRVRFLPGPR